MIKISKHGIILFYSGLGLRVIRDVPTTHTLYTELRVPTFVAPPPYDLLFILICSFVNPNGTFQDVSLVRLL